VDGYVLISPVPGVTLPKTDKRGTPHDLQTNGQPAREWAVNDWYDLSFLTSHGVASVSVEIPTGRPSQPVTRAASLTAIGRHVGADVMFDRHDPIGAQYALAALPKGVRVLDLDRESGGYVTYRLGPASSRSVPASAASVGRADADTSDPARPLGQASAAYASTLTTTSPGRRVQGHATQVIRTDRTLTGLTIINLRPGVSLTVSTGSGVTTLANLYTIADGISWVG
jgi:hypothetical protein